MPRDEDPFGPDDSKLYSDEDPMFAPMSEEVFRQHSHDLKRDLRALDKAGDDLGTITEAIEFALDTLHSLPHSVTKYHEDLREFDRSSVADDVDVHLCDVDRQLRDIRAACDNVMGTVMRRMHTVKHVAAEFFTHEAPVSPSEDPRGAIDLMTRIFAPEDTHVVGPIETDDVEATTAEIHRVLNDLAARTRSNNTDEENN